jgi:hypothetical protein
MLCEKETSNPFVYVLENFEKNGFLQIVFSKSGFMKTYFQSSFKMFCKFAKDFGFPKIKKMTSKWDFVFK